MKVHLLKPAACTQSAPAKLTGSSRIGAILATKWDLAGVWQDYDHAIAVIAAKGEYFK